jgi:hypothetical protein
VVAVALRGDNYLFGSAVNMDIGGVDGDFICISKERCDFFKLETSGLMGNFIINSQRQNEGVTHLREFPPNAHGACDSEADHNQVIWTKNAPFLMVIPHPAH